MNSLGGFFLFLVLSLQSFAQTATIKGKAEAYKGREIGLYVYDDLITERQLKLNSDTVNNDGEFQLQFQSEITQRIFLKTGNQKAHLYVEPGKNYTVKFPPKDTGRYLNPHVEQLTNLFLIAKDTTEINDLIIDYNLEFEKFWEENYQLFLAKRSRAAIDSFQLKMARKYKGINNEYFHTYLQYSIASLKESTMQNHERLIFEYIVHRPIRYSSYEYMNYFNTAFKEFLSMYSLKPEGAGITREINENASYEGLMKILSYDKYLKNDTLREFVLLKGLNDLQGNSRYNRKKIMNILEQIQSRSRVQEHRKIAFNILNSDSYLHLGALAPDFTLKNKDGKDISLKDLSGKYVYLSFFQTGCTDCLKELKVIADLKKKHSDKVVFISISADKEIDNFRQFLLKNPSFNWTFLFAGEQHPVLEDYKVRAFPEYYFINPQGKFEQCPAERPDKIENAFKAIKIKK
jgi:peroxiredoxin